MHRGAGGRIAVIQAVADQVDSDLEDLGERSLQNAAEPVGCWAVRSRHIFVCRARPNLSVRLGSASD